MPVLMFTTGELMAGALQQAREASEEVLRLADLSQCPLNPGESVDARYHRIAKLGKRLAEAFVALDEMMKETAKAHAEMHTHVHGAPPSKPDDDKSN